MTIKRDSRKYFQVLFKNNALVCNCTKMRIVLKHGQMLRIAANKAEILSKGFRIPPNRNLNQK